LDGSVRPDSECRVGEAVVVVGFDGAPELPARSARDDVVPMRFQSPMATAVGDRGSVRGGLFRRVRCIDHDDDPGLVHHRDMRTHERPRTAQHRIVDG
jgi:hypothetical protein